MRTLNDVLTHFRTTAKTEREKADHFEHLAQLCFQHEPRYKDLYSTVWLWEAWVGKIYFQINAEALPDSAASRFW